MVLTALALVLAGIYYRPGRLAGDRRAETRGAPLPQRHRRLAVILILFDPACAKVEDQIGRFFGERFDFERAVGEAATARAHLELDALGCAR